VTAFSKVLGFGNTNALGKLGELSFKPKKVENFGKNMWHNNECVWLSFKKSDFVLKNLEIII
jgi:hypothetical protein